jgi:hypothetical protein
VLTITQLPVFSLRHGFAVGGMIDCLLCEDLWRIRLNGHRQRGFRALQPGHDRSSDIDMAGLGNIMQQWSVNPPWFCRLGNRELVISIPRMTLFFQSYGRALREATPRLAVLCRRQQTYIPVALDIPSIHQSGLVVSRLCQLLPRALDRKKH